ncbi:MAG: PhnD/SsuA/transferrin family substrate-binding protein, partial [Rhodospirillales bacterium]|nr:PhnD/SsuA/transferrin family substrate-binding protein [Rhodospirillales bacterium]
MDWRRILRAVLLVILALATGHTPALADTDTKSIVRLGVLAFRGKADAIARWTPTAEYLSRTVAGTKFFVEPLTLAEMAPAVARGDIDFILTNTGNYVDLEARYGISRIATIRAPKGVEVGNLFGAVIFTRADRDDIRTLKDLKGKSFIAVQEEGFGGFQMAWRELEKNGIDPFTDFSELKFSGFPQDQVALVVLRGGADAGTFRTDTLETMAAEGKIRMQDFKVLDRQHHPGFPYMASTRLYPEWPFAKAPGTPDALSQKTAIALLGMPADSPAAKAGRYAGWTVPLDYQPVHELFRELRIGPYAELGEITPGDLFRQYGHWVSFLVFALFLSVAWATRIEVVVARRTKELREANEELERQVTERRKAEAEARQRQAELAHVSRLSIMGEMAAGFAHELNQPLAAIINYAQGCVRRLRTGTGQQEEVLDAMERVSEQATRAAEIIRRIRGFVRKEEHTHRPVDINALIRDVVELMEG